MLEWLKVWVHQEVPPAPLWHFTGGAGLRSILASEQLWATDTTSLDDPLELRYGRRIFCDVLRNTTWRCQPETLAVLHGLADEETLARYVDGLALRVFVVSLCAVGDDAAMWREYTDMARGGEGFAIGFAPRDAHAWAQLNGPEPNSLFLRSVIYDPTVQARACRELVEGLIPILESAHDQGGLATGAASDFAHALTEGLLELSAWCKDPVFSGEQEWRLVYQRWDGQSSVPVDRRHGTRGELEFVRLWLPNGVGSRFDRLPVTVVRCGPGCDLAGASEAVAMAGDWRHVAIVSSDLDG